MEEATSTVCCPFVHRIRTNLFAIVRTWSVYSVLFSSSNYPLKERTGQHNTVREGRKRGDRKFGSPFYNSIVGPFFSRKQQLYPLDM